VARVRVALRLPRAPRIAAQQPLYALLACRSQARRQCSVDVGTLYSAASVEGGGIRVVSPAVSQIDRL